MENESARNIKINTERKIIILTGAPHYGKDSFGTPYTVKQMAVEADQLATSIGVSGDSHFCGKTKEMYMHIQSKADPSLYNYVNTVEPVSECEDCRPIIKQLKEELRIKELERKRKESIKPILQLDDDTLSYEWAIAQVGIGEDDSLWIRYGQGCSCSWITDEEWMPFTEVQQAHQAVRHIGNAHERADFIADAQGLL
jgi:hypothetical protein